MNSTNDTTTKPGIEMPLGEKIAGCLILAMIVYLVIAQ